MLLDWQFSVQEAKVARVLSERILILEEEKDRIENEVGSLTLLNKTIITDWQEQTIVKANQLRLVKMEESIMINIFPAH